MKINVSSSHNIDGTLILPLFEGTEIVPEAHATGLHPRSQSTQRMRLYWKWIQAISP